MATRSRFEFAAAAAVAWIMVPVAWGAAALLEEEASGGSSSVLGAIGLVALGTAGLLMLLEIRGVEPPPRRRGVFQIGIAVHVVGVLAAIVLFWAVPLWGAIYAIAMVLYATAVRRMRLAATVIALGMVAGIASLVVLTALEVGTPDPQYGDYPIAWFTASTVASVGGALGSILLRRVGEPAPEQVPASV